jgi:NAD(P)-dependent dehydrogenase (short-subunit alcohol dehydrogenase family)
MPRYDLTDKVLLITGASGGIGSASARKLVAKGAKVALVDLGEFHSTSQHGGCCEQRSHPARGAGPLQDLPRPIVEFDLD